MPSWNRIKASNKSKETSKP